MKQNSSRGKLLSVCIPTYEMYGVGHVFLRESLGILSKQTFRDFNVVISDYSTDDLVKKVCDEFSSELDVIYTRNTDPVGGMCANANNALAHGTGKLLKLLFQDDFLYGPRSLEQIVKNFNLEHDHWLVSACTHTKDRKNFFQNHFPKYKQNIHLGGNTIGSPSVLTIKKEDVLTFDIALKMFMDCDYYKRCYDAYGLPKILNDINVVIGVGGHQITNTEVNDEIRRNEYEYIIKKYNTKTFDRDITVVAVSGIDPTSAVRALELSIDRIHFKQALLISHTSPDTLDERITFRQCLPTELQNRDRKNTTDYSRFIAYELAKYIETEYALIVHNNAHVLRPEKWDDEFYNYDYIGAPWKPGKHFTDAGINIRVGNGGFSFRSKRLLNILNELKLPFTDNGTGQFNEDGILCVYYRKILEEHGIKFAPPEIAARFSLEQECPESVFEPFGFHDNMKAVPRFFFIKFAIRKFIKNFRKNFIKS